MKIYNINNKIEAAYWQEKIRMLEFNHDYIENYIDITDFEWSEANTVGNYFAFSENGINLIGPELRNWKEKR